MYEWFWSNFVPLSQYRLDSGSIVEWSKKQTALRLGLIKSQDKLLDIITLKSHFFLYKTLCQLLSHVRLFATPRTVACQTLLSLEFSRQEYWSGQPFPSPEDLPDPGIKPGFPALQADSLPTELQGKPLVYLKIKLIIRTSKMDYYITVTPLTILLEVLSYSSVPVTFVYFRLSFI